MIPALLALVLVAADPGTATAAGGAAAPGTAVPPLEVLEAEEVDYDVAHERGVARGGVVLRRGPVVLRADSASYDLRTGEIDATGSVLLTEPGRVLAAESMHALLDGGFQAREVVAFLKEGPLDLSRCRTLEEGRKTGRNRLTVQGDVLTREPPPPGEPDHLYVESARVTLCDCGMGAPSWQIRSRRADVIPGKRAILWWPVFYITPRFLLLHTPVPVFALPALYLPLGDRQTGLLIPAVTFGGSAGFGISQPLYVTLGRSWDTTVTADYVFGPTPRVKGPGTSVELRWAPAEGMHGEIRAFLLHGSLDGWPAGSARAPGGNRISVAGWHEHRISDSTFYRVELGLIDDPLYLQDFTGDALLRATEYRRSAVAATHRTDDLVVEADAAYHLPLRFLDSGSATPGPFGIFGADLATFHRLPSASVMLLPVRVAGPLRLSGTAGVARFAPLRGPTGDEGLDGVGPGQRVSNALGWGVGVAPDAGERDGRWNGPVPGVSPGERLAATRALVRAEIRAPMTWDSRLSVEPWLATTAAAYAFEAALPPQADARLSGGVALSTRIGRTYGEGAGRVRHEIEPRVEWRGGTAQAGPGLPNYAYDELDAAPTAQLFDPTTRLVRPQRNLSAIPGAFSQLQLSVRNRLVAPEGTLSRTFLELTLGQDLDLDSGLPSESWGRASLNLPFFAVGAGARVRAFGAVTPAGTPPPETSSRLDAFTELSTSLVLFDRRGDNLHATFGALGAGASPRVLAGLEPFFDPRPYSASPVAGGSVGFTARWSGAWLTYDALFTGRDSAPACAGVTRSPHVYQHQANFVWDSPCRCWKAGVAAILNECDARPRFGVILDLSSLGARNVAAF